ncbi:MAG: hypothetical protein HC821_05365 [Lewinella sp.]|nr:hypothetical protein [Lewinella sp.]
MAFRIYGIRHHGPGSARRLHVALTDWQPDCLLIEGPADGQPIAQELFQPGMEPPIALVLYAEDQIERASFLPFATFSPEYQAMRWAATAQVPFHWIDLPAAHYLAQPEKASEQLQLFVREKTPTTLDEEDVRLAQRLRQDPLSLLAELAGYTDSERWWDATVERGQGKAEEVFAALLEAVGQLRSSHPTANDVETLQREAFMRLELRKAIKAGYERIAVVVGAWHGPALANTLEQREAADRAMLKGLAKVKVKAAWVPWSYPRLSRSSGYRAGLVSPAWYELLFTSSASATEQWMVAAAQLLRAEGFEASPALAADGVRLAKSLAALRGQALAGAEELAEAMGSTLAQGQSARVALVLERLYTGTRVGRVPEGASTVPLYKDLYQELKATRLASFWETTGSSYLKSSKTNPRGGIDLRQANDLRKSQLLHRLNLLGISWGHLQAESPHALGSFREIWRLEWQPEFSLLITERSSYGNTVALAALRFTLERASQLRAANPLAALILAALKAGLSDAVGPLVELLRDLTTHTQDTSSLLEALPTLVNTCRYGDSRKTDTSALLLLIDELVPRLTAGLAAAALGLDDEEAQLLLNRIAQANDALGRLGSEDLTLICNGLAAALDLRWRSPCCPWPRPPFAV